MNRILPQTFMCALVSAVVVVLVAMRCILPLVRLLRPRKATPSTPHNSTAVAHPVVTDVTISSTDPPSTETNPRIWRRIEKELYLHKSRRTAWLYVALKEEEELEDEDLLVMNIRVGETPPDAGPSQRWDSRPGGIWVLRSRFSGSIGQAVTEVDILFGMDAVDPRPQWALMHSSLQLDGEPDIPVARLSVLQGRAKPRLGARADLRVRADGTFKIVQISDTHMVTGTGVCKDAIDADGRYLPDGEADPLTTKFIETILDVEKPDLVVLTGDQLHHDVPDSQTALFKALAPIIQRKIPFAAVFGNHDDEGVHALSRKSVSDVDYSALQGGCAILICGPGPPTDEIAGTAQMSILENLPFSLCEAGPEWVDGVGNFHIQVLASAQSKRPALILYFLDSHGAIPSWRHRPDYQPISQNQINWFVKTSEEIQRELEKDEEEDCIHGSLVFHHIPVPEFKDRRLIIHSGRRREPTEGPSNNTHLYDALVKQGVSVLACGHDHVNDFCALLRQDSQSSGSKGLQGPWLCYGGVSGFGGYCSYGRERYHRQMRIFELDTSKECIKTWMRDEHETQRVGELVLVQGGKVVDPPGKDEGRSCVVS